MLHVSLDQYINIFIQPTHTYILYDYANVQLYFVDWHVTFKGEFIWVCIFSQTMSIHEKNANLLITLTCLFKIRNL